MGAPSRCRRLKRRAEPCQHRGEGAEVPDTPPGSEGAGSLAPCLGNRIGHIMHPLAAKAPNAGKGGRGERKVPPPRGS